MSSPGLFDKADLAEILGDHQVTAFDSAAEVTEELLLPSDELGRVARRIAGQYVGVLARYVAGAFGRTGALDIAQVKGSVDALRRLARAADDKRQLALLDDLSGLIDGLASPRRTRAAQRALSALSQWIPTFAETLEPEDARSLLELVRWEKGSAPLLDELSTIHGIGQRRLSRLYAAGLFTVEAVANANPEEVVQVTGLPRPLAHEVVERTRSYADQERRRCLEEVRDRGHRLRALVRSIRLDSEPALQSLAAEALSAVEQALAELSREPRGGA